MSAPRNDNLCPVDFGGWFDRRESEDAGCLAFWLEYWVASYEHLLAQDADSLTFLSYEALCEDREHAVRLLAGALGSRDPDALLSTATTIRSPKPRDVDTQAVPPSLLERADYTYAMLTQAALNTVPCATC